MLSDPIADMLTRIRNATRTFKESVDIPASKFKEELAKLLVKEGYVASYERFSDGCALSIFAISTRVGSEAGLISALPVSNWMP